MKTTSRTTLYVRNMVCPRCIRVVREELTRLGLDLLDVRLGEVLVAGPKERIPIDSVKRVLGENGFELIENKNAKTIERIKHAVLELVRLDANGKQGRVRNSAFIAQRLDGDYHALSSLFSAVENITLERYIILQRIERVKELLKYGELTLSEIAYLLGYSSAQHLSAQFRQVTGMTPTTFKRRNTNTRKPIDSIGKR